jgi:hypothetical protein
MSDRKRVFAAQAKDAKNEMAWLMGFRGSGFVFAQGAVAKKSGSSDRLRKSPT